MTIPSVVFKEHERIIPNPNGHISGLVHWWSGLGSSSSGSDLGLGKGSTPQFTIFPGSLKVSEKRGKSLKLFQDFSKQSVSTEPQGRAALGYSQSLYAYADPSGLLSTYGSQFTGRIMLPLDITIDEGPIYVNAKQYHAIIRRRISRAKVEAVNKTLKVRKPYLHRSRHLHAMRRVRGPGGRFLNTKNSNSNKTSPETGKTKSGNFSLSFESQNSEIFQSDSGILRSPNEATGRKTNLFGTEVTSLFSNPNFEHFSSNHLRPFVHPLSEMINTGHGLAMPSKWT